MRRVTRLGTLLLLAPLAGCASLPFGGVFSSRMPEPAEPPGQSAKAEAGAQADFEGALLGAQIRRKSGDLAAAAKTLSQLVLAAPDDPRVLGEYGKTLAAQGRSDDALAFLDRAMQLSPADWTLFSARGVAYDRKGDYAAAQASYARALQLKPGEPSILNNSALSHVQAGDLDGAERLLREAAPGTSEFPRIANNLALIQSLRAAQPPRSGASAMLSAPAVSPPDPEPMPIPITPPIPTAPPVSRVELAPAPVPRAEPDPSGKPETPLAGDIPKTYAALMADPTVVMQPLPAKKPAEVSPGGAKPPVKSAEAKEPPKAAKPQGQGRASTYYVQAGAFGSESRAGQIASALDPLGARVMAGTSNGRAIYRVRIGPFLNVEQANTAIVQAKALGHTDLAIVTP